MVMGSTLLSGMHKNLRLVNLPVFHSHQNFTIHMAKNILILRQKNGPMKMSKCYM